MAVRGGDCVGGTDVVSRREKVPEWLREHIKAMDARRAKAETLRAERLYIEQVKISNYSILFEEWLDLVLDTSEFLRL